MAKVFFSYSHRGEGIRDELEKHLSILKRQGFIETWHDRRIGAGAEFGHEISENLETADVILRHCDWHDAPFGKLLATPQDGKPVTRFPTLDDQGEAPQGE